MPDPGAAIPMSPAPSLHWIRIRQVVAGLALLLLSLPASDLRFDAEWKLHVWSRLRQLGRSAPDTAQDRFNREVVPYLPPTGRVGFVNVSAEDPKRAWFFMQYSLAPRTVVESIDEEFVVQYGVPRGPAGLNRNERYVLVKAISDELQVFRRVSR